MLHRTLLTKSKLPRPKERRKSHLLFADNQHYCLLQKFVRDTYILYCILQITPSKRKHLFHSPCCPMCLWYQWTPTLFRITANPLYWVLVALDSADKNCVPYKPIQGFHLPQIHSHRNSTRTTTTPWIRSSWPKYLWDTSALVSQLKCGGSQGFECPRLRAEREERWVSREERCAGSGIVRVRGDKISSSPSLNDEHGIWTKGREGGINKPGL